MGDSWQNKPVEITSGTPKDVAPMRKSLIDYITANFSKGATPYSGNVAAGVNPLQTQGAQILAKLMGGNYSSGTPIGGNTGGPGSGFVPYTGIRNKPNGYVPNPNGDYENTTPGWDPYDPGLPKPPSTLPETGLSNFLSQFLKR